MLKVSTKILTGCGALLAAGLTQATLVAGQLPPAGRSVFSGDVDIKWVPVASTEELHAAEGTSVLHLLTDYEAFVVRLLLTKAHLRAGIEAYESGNVGNALAHLGQPVDVLHEDLDRWLRTPGAEPFEAVLDELVAAVRAKASIDVVNQELGTALSAIDGALEKLDVDLREAPGFIMLVTVAVVGAAADEYALAISDGHIVDMIEYQDARAFILEARAYAKAASAGLMAKNAGAYGILMAEFAALDMALPPEAGFLGTPTKLAELRRAVARIALLYSSFK